MPTIIVEIFSDYVCPFCWLAAPAVQTLARSDPQVAAVWRPYELRPEPVPTLDPCGDYLRRIWERSVYPLAARLRIDIRLPPRQPRSRLAHEAAHWARQQGHFDEYHDAVFRAFFQRGEDIGDMDVLTSLAIDIGADGESLRDALERRTFEASVLEDERDATALGVTRVPAFIGDRKAALTGAQPVENLRHLIRHVNAA